MLVCKERAEDSSIKLYLMLVGAILALAFAAAQMLCICLRDPFLYERVQSDVRLFCAFQEGKRWQKSEPLSELRVVERFLLSKVMLEETENKLRKELKQENARIQIPDNPNIDYAVVEFAKQLEKEGRLQEATQVYSDRLNFYCNSLLEPGLVTIEFPKFCQRHQLFDVEEKLLKKKLLLAAKIKLSYPWREYILANLAKLEAARNRPDQAEKWLLMHSAGNTDLLLLAWCQDQLGRTDEAESSLKHVLNVELPELRKTVSEADAADYEYEVHWTYASFLKRNNRHSEAKKHYQFCDVGEQCEYFRQFQKYPNLHREEPVSTEGILSEAQYKQLKADYGITF